MKCVLELRREFYSLQFMEYDLRFEFYLLGIQSQCRQVLF